MPTHLTLPEQTPPWTRAAKAKSPFEGGQPRDASSGARQGDVYDGRNYRYAPTRHESVRTRSGISHGLSECIRSLIVIPINGRERSDRRSKSRQHNLKDYLPHWREHSRKGRNQTKPVLCAISWTQYQPRPGIQPAQPERLLPRHCPAKPNHSLEGAVAQRLRVFPNPSA